MQDVYFSNIRTIRCFPLCRYFKLFIHEICVLIANEDNFKNCKTDLVEVEIKKWKWKFGKTMASLIQ